MKHSWGGSEIQNIFLQIVIDVSQDRCREYLALLKGICERQPDCFKRREVRRRILASSCYLAFFRGYQRIGTKEYWKMMRLRKIWGEGSFSVLKREHGLSRIRKRGIRAATEECLLATMALNLKRMVKAILLFFTR